MATNPDRQSPWTGLGLAAAGGTAYKAMKDLQGIERGALQWLRGVQSAPRNGDLFTNTQEMARRYSDGGSALVRARVAGVPVPYAALRGMPVGETLMSRNLGKLKDYGKAIFGGELPDKYRHAHYRRFFKDSPTSIRDYIMTHSADTRIDPQNLQILTKSPALANAALEELKLSNPGQHALLLEHLNTKQRYLGGLGLNGGGAVQAYIHGSVGPLRRLQRGLGGLAVGLGTAGAASLAGSLMQPTQLFGKSAGTVDTEDAAAIGAGAYLGGRGLHNLNRPLDVATTWTEAVHGHGAGHMMPGKALHTAFTELQRDPRAPRFRLHNAVRNQYGVMEPGLFGRKLDMLVDTGLGFTAPDYMTGLQDPNHQFEAIRLRGFPKPRVRAGGYVGYMTDLGKLGVPHEGFKHTVETPGRRLMQLLGVKDNYVGFGPQQDFDRLIAESGGRYRGHNLSPGGFPMFSPSAVNALQETHTDRDGVLKRLMSNPALDEGQRALLDKYKNEKMISVLGSGRGDYTALRTLEIARELKRRGLQDRVMVSTILGDLGKKNPISAQLAKYPNVLAFSGRLPQREYIGLPAIADLVDASTGTSSLYESLASPSKVVMRDSWAPLKNRELKLLGDRRTWSGVGPWKAPKVDATREGLLGSLRNIDLDGWNHGNRNVAGGFPGVRRVSNAREIVDELLAGGNEVARGRGADILSSSAKGSATLRETLRGLLRRQNILKNIRGGAQLAAGAGLASVPLFRHNDALQFAR